MPIYEFVNSQFAELPITQFSSVGIRERSDLQRALRDQIGLISPDTLVIAEEFGDWDESRRRIDLLGVDKQANLVVIELKRSDDGGYMDLQALRYAAMISSMTFEKAAEVYSRYLTERGRNEDASQGLLDFLGWSEADEKAFAPDVRLVLAAADFSKELTTSVLWLNDHDVDVRCVRLRPHADGKRLILDIQQVIPLPEASEYLVGVREKATEVRQALRKQAQWGGEWYVNLGMDSPQDHAIDSRGRGYERHWDNCRKYGYLSSGGGPKYSKPLRDKLKVGDRVWAYQAQAGYLGTGVVTRPAVPIHEFKLEDQSKLVDRLNYPGINEDRDPDHYAYAVGVSWDATVPLSEAKSFPGKFANQNIVCKLTDEKTLDFLAKEFPRTTIQNARS
jgi:hypothetical protein